MRRKHLLTLIAVCGLIGGAVGITISIAGIFYASVAAELGVGRGSIAMTTTLCSIVGAVVALFLPKLLKDSTIKPIVIVASILLVGGAAGMAFCSSLWQLYLLSIVRGVGSGLVNFIFATTLLNNWFYAKRGIFTSLVMAFTGVPGMLLSNVFTNIIQSQGWRTGYIAVAIAVLLFCLPAIVFPLTIKPEAQNEKPFGYEEFLAAKEEGEIQTVTPSDHFNYGPMFFLVLLYASLSCLVPAIPGHFPGYAESIGQSAALGALMLSVSSACNIGSKIAFGTMTDKIGVIKTISIMTIMCVSGTFMLMFLRSDLGLLIGSGLFTFSFAVSSVGISLVCLELFGMENYGKTYPLINLIGGICNALAATLVGTVYDISGSYMPNYYAALVIEVIVVLSLVIAYGMKKKNLA